MRRPLVVVAIAALVAAGLSLAGSLGGGSIGSGGGGPNTVTGNLTVSGGVEVTDDLTVGGRASIRNGITVSAPVSAPDFDGGVFRGINMDLIGALGAGGNITSGGTISGSFDGGSANLSTASINGEAVAGFFQSDAGGGAGFVLGVDAVCVDNGCAESFYDGPAGWTFDGQGVKVTSLEMSTYIFNSDAAATCSGNIGAVCVDDVDGLVIAAGDGGTFVVVSPNPVDADAGVVRITPDSLMLPVMQSAGRACSSTNNNEIVATSIPTFGDSSQWFCDGITKLWRPLFQSEATSWRTPDDTASVAVGFELAATRPIGVEGHVVSCEGDVWTPGTCTASCTPPANAILRVQQTLLDGGSNTLCDLEILCTAAQGTHHFVSCHGYFLQYGVDGGSDIVITYAPQADGGTCSKLPVANGRCRANFGRSTLP